MKDRERIELHIHTKMSINDGVGDVVDYIEKAHNCGMKALAITDHCNVCAFVDAYNYVNKQFKKKYPNDEPPKIIYGIEGYLVEDKDIIDLQTEENEYYKKNKKIKSYHVTILVKNDIGRVNLYKIVSDSYTKFMHNEKPYIPKSLIDKYREGLLIGSACIVGELFDAIVKNKNDNELKKISKFYDYLEIQPLTNNSYLLKEKSEKFKTVEDLKEMNIRVIKIAEKLKIPVVATSDCHYVEKDDKTARYILQHGAMYKDLRISDRENASYKGIDYRLHKTEENLYFRTTKEMLDEFSYLDTKKAYEVVVKNTNMISEKIENISPLRLDKLDLQYFSPERLKNICYSALKQKGLDSNEEICNRLEYELKYIINHKYHNIFMIFKELTDYSYELGYPVISYGIIASSLVGYLIGITDVNPLSQKLLNECNISEIGFDLPFESFIGLIENKKTSFSSVFKVYFNLDIRDKIRNKLKNRYTINGYFPGKTSFYRNKTANEFLQLFLIHNYDVKENENVVNDLSKKIEGCMQGIHCENNDWLIFPFLEYIHTFTPVQSYFDYGYYTQIDYHNFNNNSIYIYLHGDPQLDTLKKLEDYTGVKSQSIVYTDEKILSLFASSKIINIDSKKIPELKYGISGLRLFDTMDILSLVKIKTLEDVICYFSISHNMINWKGNFDELIKNHVCEISDLPCYMEHIFNKLTKHGVDKKNALNIMEKVYNGKGLKDEYIDIMRLHNIPDYYINSCLKIKRIGPKAPIVTSTIISLKLAWYKIYKPDEFYKIYFKEYWGLQAEEILNMNDLEIREKIKQIEEKIKRIGDEFFIIGSYDIKSNLTMCRVVLEMRARGIYFTYEEIKKHEIYH